MGYCVLAVCRYIDARSHIMEYSSESHLDCLLVYSAYPSHLRSVAAMLHVHRIQVEEMLH
jgi:hypothetical protein